MRKKLNLTIWEKLVDPLCAAAADTKRTVNDVANQALEHFLGCVEAENPLECCHIAKEVLAKRGIIVADPAAPIAHLLNQYAGPLTDSQCMLFWRLIEAALHAGIKPDKKWLASAAELARHAS